MQRRLLAGGGYHAWQTQTRRYTNALHVVPATGPGYFNKVLGA
ncbi:hypothetical protein [Streptomyces roseus]|nr:hypothetical protein [Streptomyces roseus]